MWFITDYSDVIYHYTAFFELSLEKCDLVSFLKVDTGDYCTISINSAVTCHKASGHGQNPLLVPGHRSSGRRRKTIGQKGQNSLFFSSHMGSSQLSELNFT